MEYNVRLMNLNKTPMDIDGIVEPLCNSCMAIDCTNPIAKTQVSLFGEEQTYRLYSHGSSYKMVIDCDGYMRGSGVEEEEEFEED